MKRILLTLILMLALGVTAAHAIDPFFEYGEVYTAAGTSGTAVTENSFAAGSFYRPGVADEIGTLVDNSGKVYEAGYTPGLPAYGQQDLASDWNTTINAGQVMVAAYEVDPSLNGWTGADSYIAVVQYTITAADLISSGVMLPGTKLKVIPTPQISAVTTGQVVLSITGMNENYIYGYNLYRSTAPAGVYSQVGSVLQDKGNSIQYIDTAVSEGTSYYYKWGVNFDWGGGSAAVYLTSTAKSKASGAAAVPVSSSTFTMTYTFTATYTATGTDTSTDTPTGTPTSTATGTSTATPTSTDTATGTPTITPTRTPASYVAVNLQSACGFAVLDGSGFTNSGISTITGDLGSWPTISETGLGTLTIINGIDHAGDAFTQAAKNYLVTAYIDASTRTKTATVATELGGTVLTPGVYNTLAGTLGLTGTLTLDGNGDDDAVFIFQADSTLVTAANSNVNLINNAHAKNVFWVVGSSATLAASTAFAGTIMAMDSIDLALGATIDGSLLARNAHVTLTGGNSVSAGCGANTPTNTPVDTKTGTPTNTPTGTPTGTKTGTPTNTPTNTPVDTATDTPVNTPTSTPVDTATITPTATRTPVPTPPVNSQPIAYPQPADSTITFAYKLLAPSSSVSIYVYNLMGAQVAVFGPAAGVTGVNSYTPPEGISKFAPGIYFYIVKAPDSGTKFNVDKFIVER